MRKPASYHGFTLLELLITLSVLSILMGVGVSSYRSLFADNQLKGAAESVYSVLNYARSEAIKRGKEVALSVKPATEGKWCVGLAVDPLDSCDCSQDTCKLDSVPVVFAGTEFSKVSLDATDFANFATARHLKTTATFDPIRGLAERHGKSGEIKLTADGKTLKVTLNKLGSVDICVKSGSIAGYAPC